ncbi:MAG: hypothetical protein ACI89E_000583, partial [Planctomycetota bacterium]
LLIGVTLPASWVLTNYNLLTGSVFSDHFCPWWIETQNHAWRGDELLWIYGLHEMCGFAWEQVAERIERPASFARRRAKTHKALMLTDADYGDRVQQITYGALGRPAAGDETCGTTLPPMGGRASDAVSMTLYLSTSLVDL